MIVEEEAAEEAQEAGWSKKNKKKHMATWGRIRIHPKCAVDKCAASCLWHL